MSVSVSSLSAAAASGALRWESFVLFSRKGFAILQPPMVRWGPAEGLRGCGALSTTDRSRLCSTEREWSQRGVAVVRPMALS